eukprot:11288686-Alexandrium_andersonii.AAC.1
MPTPTTPAPETSTGGAVAAAVDPGTAPSDGAAADAAKRTKGEDGKAAPTPKLVPEAPSYPKTEGMTAAARAAKAAAKQLSSRTY